MIKLDPARQFFWKGALSWIFLKAFSAVYGTLLYFWRLGYLLKIRKPVQCKVPVISVGNITIGGTGKTPLISKILDLCQEANVKASVLTRGYKADNGGELIVLDQHHQPADGANSCGDEPWLLSKRHREVSIYISPRRVVAARIAERESQILLLDDGMQHLQLSRELNLVLIDSLAGVGNGQLLPLGPLREPLSCLKRADIIIYTKTNLKSSQGIRRKITPYLPPHTLEFDSQYLPSHLISAKDGRSLSLSELDDKRCLLFSGIGNPSGFAEVVKGAGGSIVDHLILDDHQIFDDKCLNKLELFMLSHPAEYVICTEKDWVKLEEDRTKLPDFFYLEMVVVNDRELDEYLYNFLNSHSKKN